MFQRPFSQKAALPASNSWMGWAWLQLTTSLGAAPSLTRLVRKASACTDAIPSGSNIEPPFDHDQGSNCHVACPGPAWPENTKPKSLPWAAFLASALNSAHVVGSVVIPACWTSVLL